MNEWIKTLFLSHQINYFNMKFVRFILALFSFIAVLSSCSTDVELYASYKDVAIIYGLLDAHADTNFIKITRAFCGTNDNPIDATEVALIADSSNYPGKLDARIIEFESMAGNSYEPTGRVLVLDTMTFHNKEEGVFYAPDQIVYYTPEPLYTGSDGRRYKYRLVVVKPDGDTVTAQTTMVGDEDFAIVSASVGFQASPTDELGKIYFRSDGVAPLYEIGMRFNYHEQHAGAGIAFKSISLPFGTKPLSNYKKLEYSDNSYYQEYSLNWLFNALENTIGGDTVVDANHPNVVRYIDDLVISLSAAGEDLYYYYLANEAQQSIGITSVYSNINGGFGLFSSRSSIEKAPRLSSRTLTDLYDKSAWGFKAQ